MQNTERIGCSQEYPTRRHLEMIGLVFAELLNLFAGAFGFDDELGLTSRRCCPKRNSGPAREVGDEAFPCTLETWFGVSLDDDRKAGVDGKAACASD